MQKNTPTSIKALFLISLILSPVYLTGCSTEQSAQKPAVIAPETEASTSNQSNTDWPYLDLDEQGLRYSTLDKIKPDNVAQLGLAWEFKDFVVRGRTHRAVESNPIVVDGKMYLSGPWGVAYALDAKTGKHLWTYDPKADGQYARITCCDAVNRGVAVIDGLVYTASLDGFLIAIDAETGKEVWKVDTFYTRKWNASITSAPFIAGDNIMIGNSGADMGARGYVSAYNRKTGELVWRFWAVPGDPETEPDENEDVALARTTWPEDTIWEYGLGGNPWGGLSYDSETNTAFLALGNGGPHPAWQRNKSGLITDQLFLTCIVAVDATTGKMKWYYQTTPGDSWDYAATSPMIMANMDIDGKARKVIMQAPKNGLFYVLDRDTGELLRADPFTDVTWTSGVDMKTGRPVISESAKFKDGYSLIWPSVAGAHSWTPMSYSPKTNLVYLQVFEAAMRYVDTQNPAFKPGTANHGTHNEFPPFDQEDDAALLVNAPEQKFSGTLKAWDPDKGEARWTAESPAFLNGGTLVVNDIVFWGSSTGHLNAYHTETGAQLLNLEIGTNILAAPITYEIDGEQYIALTAGAGGPQGPFFAPGSAAHKYENYERLIVLKLDGKQVPLPAEVKPVPQNPIPEAIIASNEVMQHGQTVFQEQCHRCHSLGGSRGIYPDLWNISAGAVQAFEPILKGAYRYAGMGDFSDTLSDDDIAAIKAFIVNDIIEKRKNGPESGAQFRSGSH